MAQPPVFDARRGLTAEVIDGLRNRAPSVPGGEQRSAAVLGAWVGEQRDVVLIEATPHPEAHPCAAADARARPESAEQRLLER